MPEKSKKGTATFFDKECGNKEAPIKKGYRPLFSLEMVEAVGNEFVRLFIF
jgi:hypothetical protein